MNDLPLHPAIVHLPLGLAAIAPLAAAGLCFAIMKGLLTKRSWTALVALQAILLLGGLAALWTGDQEEERVEARLSEEAIKRHEELGERFVWAAGATFVLSGAALALAAPGATSALMVATALAATVTAGFAFEAGHAGGALVYGAGGLAGPVASGDGAATPAPAGARARADDD